MSLGGNIFGVPAPQTPPVFTKATFNIYIPKLDWYTKDQQNIPLFDKAVERMKLKLNYGYWQEEWEEAMSLAVAHFILITDPRFATSTDGDATSGGVMRERSVGGISYSYDLEYFVEKNAGYSYWNTTGYGRRLVALSNARGWIGVFTSD